MDRRRLMMQSKGGGGYPVPPIIYPEGYSPLEYINRVGKAYIDPQLVSSPNVDWEVKTAFKQVNGVQYAFGFIDWGKRTEAIDTHLAQMTFEYDWAKYVYLGVSFDEIFSVMTQGGKVFVNDVLYAEIKRQTANHPFSILACNRIDTNNRVYGNFAGRFYKFAAWENGSCIRYMLPAIRLSDGKKGLFDMAGTICSKNGTPFFENANTSGSIGGE